MRLDRASAIAIKAPALPRPAEAHAVPVTMCCFLVAALLTISGPIAKAAEARQETDFGSNPGNLRMFTYVPDGLDPAVPLIVVLHGCGQEASAFGRDAGWFAVADRFKTMLLLPEQKDDLPHDSNNPFACFNWFQLEDNTRDHGEALSIRQMVEAMVARYSVNRSRIYIVGFSAGGAMTVVMLAAYPELFAGGATIAGVPYGCAKSDRTALQCMNAGVNLSADEWRHRMGDTSALDRYSPPISIWQGDGDKVVVPLNKLQLVRQWTAVKRISAIPARTEVDGAIVREVFANDAGATAIESVTIRGLGHAFPIRTDDSLPCGQPGDFVVAAGVCAAAEIVRFWGLTRTSD